MPRPYLHRLLTATASTTVLFLRQAIRQQWFLLTFVPLAVVLFVAPFLPAASDDAAYRLLVRISIGAGSLLLTVGVILSASTSLPSEVRDRTLHRTACSPAGRLAALSGRITAFALLAALVALAGLLGTLTVHFIRSGGSEVFKDASRQFVTVSAQDHLYPAATPRQTSSGVLWIDEKVPNITWVFPEYPFTQGEVKLRVVPVVASAVETTAKLTVEDGSEHVIESRDIRLFDNRPTDIEFATPPRATRGLHITIERMPGSAPFGFDTTEDQLGNEKNSLSLIVSTRPFALNLSVAWLIVWMKLCFVATIAVFASTFLSGPIASAFSLLLCLLASILGFLSEFAASLGTPGHHHFHSHIEQIPQEPSFLENILRTGLAWFTRVYPDLSLFDPVEPLVWGRAIPAAFIIAALLYYLAYSAGLWGASALILRRREF